MSEGESVVEQLILAIEAAGFPEATAAVEGLTEATEALTAATDDAAASMGGATAAGAKGKGLFGRLSSIKTLMAGLFVGESLKQFSDFQSQMERLRTQTGATQGEVGRMSKGILDMATSVGTGPNSLAKSLYHLESAGFRGKEALDALRTSAQGAKIGGADLTDTTTAMTAVMVAGFRGVHTLKQAMGQLNATVGAGDMTMQDLNDALGTGLLSTLKTLGLQVNDAGAALAVLGDNNIRGAQAATRLRMGLMQLVHPSETAQKAMHGLGLAPLKLAEDLRKPNGLLVMLQDLKGRLRDLSPTQQASDLASIFGGGRNSAAMLTLVNQMTRLKSKYTEVAKGGRDFNSDWKATTRTLAFFGDQLKALGEVALIKFGAGLAWGLERVKGFVDALQKGKPWAILLAGAIAGITVALMADTIVVWANVAAWTALSVAFALLDMNPFVLAIAAIGIAVVLVVTHFKQVKKVVVDVFDWIVAHWKLLAAIILGPFGLAIDFVATHFGTIRKIVESVFHAVVGAAEWVWHTFHGVFEALFKVMTAPFRLWLSVVKAVAGPIVSVIEWVVSKVEKLLHKIMGPLGKVLGFASKVLNIGGSIMHDVFGIGGGSSHHSSTPLPVSTSAAPILAAVGGGSGNVIVHHHHEGPEQLVLIQQLDGRQVSKSVVRQGLMAQSAR